MIILDATAHLSTAALSDTIHVVEGVPHATYDNLKLHLVHLDPATRRKPSGLTRLSLRSNARPPRRCLPGEC